MTKKWACAKVLSSLATEPLLNMECAVNKSPILNARIVYPRYIRHNKFYPDKSYLILCIIITELYFNENDKTYLESECFRLKVTDNYQICSPISHLADSAVTFKQKLPPSR